MLSFPLAPTFETCEHSPSCVCLTASNTFRTYLLLMMYRELVSLLVIDSSVLDGHEHEKVV